MIGQTNTTPATPTTNINSWLDWPTIEQTAVSEVTGVPANLTSASLWPYAIGIGTYFLFRSRLFGIAAAIAVMVYEQRQNQ
jgi:hypothetical protein